MSRVFTLNDGSLVPWLGFGTGTALFGKDATKLAELAIANGITHLDGAQMYNNEETLGAGIKASGKPRSELFITTKLKPNLDPSQTIRESLVISLSKLGVDFVDLFLIHSPTPANKEGRLQSQWAQMEELKREGLAKSIGVSNFRVDDLNDILKTATIIPAVNQIELHPYVWKASEPVVQLCKEKGITIQSYGGQTPIVRVQNGPLEATLGKISARLGDARGKAVTSGQVLTKWLLQKDIIVVTTTTKEFRIKEFQDTEDVPDLTAEEVQEISEGGAKLYKRHYMRHVYGEQ